MSLSLPINSDTAPVYVGILDQLTDKTRLENRLIYGQCPAWVISLAAADMCKYEEDYYPYKRISHGHNRTGAALWAHLNEGRYLSAKAMLIRNIDKIEKYLPGEWTGVLKQERERLKRLVK